ncbi:hypothetical protein FRB93_001367 [Tulasnella sp. JGI-2019a]|nr:hypothetical protein FRB93_001367 [Tulasnella sp. JGI-2019a]
MSAPSTPVAAPQHQGARARPAPPPLRLQSNRSFGSPSAGGTTSPRNHQLPPLISSSPSAIARGRSPAPQSHDNRLKHQKYTSSRPGQTTRNLSNTRSNSQGRSLDLLHDLVDSSGRRSVSPGSGQDVEVPARSMSPPMFSPGGTGRRSITPSHSMQQNALMSPIRSDLEVFAQHCKGWFFAQDESAGKAMQDTLTNLPPNQKPTYIKLQASIRSAFHSASSLRRLQEYRAHLSSVQPGHSLTPNLRLAPSSNEARKHRLDKFTRFIKTYCLQTAPGTLPFFEGLHGVLRLQLLPANLGGAGQQRIEWEVDDAVFMESGPKEFAQDAIDVLKGVLGFEESLDSGESEEMVGETSALGGVETDSESDLDIPVPMNTSGATSIIPSSSRYQVAPLPPALPLRVRRPNLVSPASESSPSLMPSGRLPPPAQNIPYAAQSTHSFLNRTQSRNRATSDPFSDPGGRSSPGINGSSSYISRTGTSTALSGIGEHDGDELLTEGPGEGLVANHSRHQSQPLPSSMHTAVMSNRTPTRGQQQQQQPYSPSYFPRSGRSTPTGDHPSLPLQRVPTSASRATLPLDPTDLDELVYGGSSNSGSYGIASRAPTQAELDLLQTPQMRIWVVPSYISNPELQGLLAVFPQSIAKKPLPRFSAVGENNPKKKKKKAPDLEEGGDEVHNEVQGHWRGEVKRGAGKMWVSERLRDDGWRGSMWARLMMWLKSMFS